MMHRKSLKSSYDGWSEEEIARPHHCAPVRKPIEHAGHAYNDRVLSLGATPQVRATDVEATVEATAGGATNRETLVLELTENYYELLGLGEVGEEATAKDLKLAYRKMVLKYHPDKNEAVSDEIFKKIQTAYDTLTDTEKRKEYDSTLPFDDSLPSANTPPEEFFDVFRPVFARNAKFSNAGVAPSLGNEKTPIEKVQKFYTFWVGFQSWRSWPHLNKYDPEEAESREEKRWMDRQNKSLQAQQKKAEKQRINELVVRAQKCDPRIIAHAARTEAKAEAAKKKRANAKRAAAEKRNKTQNKTTPTRAAVTPAKKKEDKELADLKVRLRKLIKEETELTTLEQNRVVADVGLVDMRALVAEGENQARREHFRVAVWKALEHKCKEISESDRKMFGEPSLAERKAIRDAALKAAADSPLEDVPAAAPVAAAPVAVAAEEKNADWTHEEIVKLAKVVAKFPVGTSNRWECVRAEFPGRTTKDIIQRTKILAAESDARRLAGVTPDAFLASQQKAKSKTTAAQARSDKNHEKELDEQHVTTVAASTTSDGDEWTAEEQKLLEEALAAHPGTGKERWTLIAEHVGTKTRKQCAMRYKYCSELVEKQS